MMQKEKSKKWAQLKYACVLPLFAVTLTAFAQCESSSVTGELSAVKVSRLVQTPDMQVAQIVAAPTDSTKTKGAKVRMLGQKGKVSIQDGEKGKNGVLVITTKTATSK